MGSFIGSGGNAQAARQGALAGGLFAGAGQLGNKLGLANDSLGRAALHAAAGCISASAGGGSCGSGGMQAGFTKFASSNLPDYGDFGNLVKYAVIGGTASAIGGDKFANGAMTGAWQYLMNEKVGKNQGKFGGEDINTRKGPVDQSGRTPRTGNPIDGPYDRSPTNTEKVGDKILDSLFKQLTGVGGLITKSPLTIAIPLATHSKGLGGCDENGSCSDIRAP